MDSVCCSFTPSKETGHSEYRRLHIFALLVVGKLLSKRGGGLIQPCTAMKKTYDKLPTAHTSCTCRPSADELESPMEGRGNGSVLKGPVPVLIITWLDYRL